MQDRRERNYNKNNKRSKKSAEIIMKTECLINLSKQSEIRKKTVKVNRP
jgi:hypothetical protein